ncbi:MAG: hypothetical protein ACTSRK_06830 [Promethearchaeota archaeon]
MPLGIVVMNWNDRSGVDIIAKFPEDYYIDNKIMLQVFSQHEYTGEAGFMAIMSENLNLASYFAGHTHQIYVVLFLTEQEDGNLFEDGLAEVARAVLMNREDEKLQEIIETQYHRLSIYPRLTKEQNLALIFNNDIKRAIISRLQEEGILLKSEMDVWIRDQFKQSDLDTNTIINSMLKANIGKMGSVQGYSDDLLFMIGDIMITRKPPKFFKNPTDYHCPESLKSTYLHNIRTFFLDYFPTEADNLNIINKIILDPVNSTVLDLLRLAIVTRSDLEKLKMKGVDNIQKAIEDFQNLNLITILKDSKGIEYFGLISDFELRPFLPKYMLNLIRKNYMVKRHNNHALIAHLEFLRLEHRRLELMKKKEIDGELPESFTATDTPMNLFLGVSDDFNS